MHLVYGVLFLIQNPGEPPVKALPVTEVQVVHARQEGCCALHKRISHTPEIWVKNQGHKNETGYRKWSLRKAGNSLEDI